MTRICESWRHRECFSVAFEICKVTSVNESFLFCSEYLWGRCEHKPRRWRWNSCLLLVVRMWPQLKWVSHAYSRNRGGLDTSGGVVRTCWFLKRLAGSCEK